MSYFATRLNFTYAEPFDSLMNRTNNLYKQILSDTFANLPSDQKRIHNRVYNRAAQQLEVKALLLPDDIWKHIPHYFTYVNHPSYLTPPSGIPIQVRAI